MFLTAKFDLGIFHPYGRSVIRVNLLILFIVFSFISCKENKVTEESEAQEIIIKDVTAKAHAFADSLLTSMSLEERVGQCFMPSLLSETAPEILKTLNHWIEDYHIGGVVLLQGDTVSAKVISDIGKRARVPMFIAIDAEWGLGMRLSGGSLYPKNGNLDKKIGETYMFDYGQQIAKESLDLGINMILGPVIDISYSKYGVIGNRSFGNDPGLVSEYGVAYAKGLEAGGVVSVAKHFPGHGRARHDSHKGVATLDSEISMLDSVELKPFREYISSGLTGIMAGHIQATSLDPTGSAATVSIDILTSLLRDEMGFKGLILTDAFDMGGAKGFTASDALRAGADIILCPLNIEKEFQDVVKNINEGSLSISILDERCRKILFTKYLFHICGDYKAL